MANLIQQANDLEYVPKDQLIQMSQNPDNNYPSYLVLAEIQRRTQNEKAYAAQQPQPETTVSEELVQEFAGQQGLQGAMAQSPGPQNAFPPSDMSNMAPPSPQMGMPSQQMMGGGLTEYAEGGITGYQVGGSPDLSGTFSSTGSNPYPTGSDNLVGTIEERALIQAGINPQGMNPEDIKNTYNLLKQDFRKDNPTLGDKAFKFMYGEEFGDEAMDYISSVPIGGLGVKSLQKGLPLIPKAYKGLKNYFKKAKTKEFKLPDVKVRGGGTAPGGVMTEIVSPAGPGRKFIQPFINNPITTSIGSTIALGGINQLTGEPEVQTNINNENTTKSTEKLEIDRLNALIAKIKNKDSKTVDTSKDRGNADMLIGLGGAILRSNTIGELGGNIADMSTARQARQDSQKLAGIQGRYYEAQTAKLEADVSNMPVKQLEFALKQLDAQIKEGAFGSEDERKEVLKRYNQLLNSYLAKTGFSSLEASNAQDAILKETGLS